jgi:hypothetical protein
MTFPLLAMMACRSVSVVDIAKDPGKQGSLARSTTVIPEHLAA